MVLEADAERISRFQMVALRAEAVVEESEQFQRAHSKSPRRAPVSFHFTTVAGLPPHSRLASYLAPSFCGASNVDGSRLRTEHSLPPYFFSSALGSGAFTVITLQPWIASAGLAGSATLRVASL